MKPYLLDVTTVLLSFLAVYLAACFITLEPNVYEWTESGRLLYLWTAVSGSAFAILPRRIKL